MHYSYLITLFCLIGIAFAIEPEKTPRPIPVAEIENNAGKTATDDGEELIEGDMVPDAKGTKEGSDRNAINAGSNNARRWPKVGNFVEVPYSFHNTLSENGKKQFLDSAADYAAWTCIKFVQRSNQKDYIEVFRGGGCYSSVGRTSGKQGLSLGSGCDTIKGIPTHEMMHALGFYHEQSRTDRDRYVYIDEANVNKGSLHNFKICGNCKNPSNLGYDYNSIMHYGATAFTINGKDTIIPRNNRNTPIGQRAGMCDMDIKKLNQMYNCNGWTVNSRKPNNGIVPCKVPYDGWSNCATDYKEKCADPYNDYQVLKSCQKTCEGVKKGDAYNGYKNCKEMADEGRCKESWMTKSCSLACETKP